VLGLGVGLAGVFFVTLRVTHDWDEFATAVAAANPLGLVAATLAGLSAVTIIGLNWLRLLRTAGAGADARSGLAWFFVGQLGKYVPGGIWPIVGQAELAHRGGISRLICYSSTGISMIATLLGSVVVAVSSGLLSAHERRLVAAMLGVGLVAVFACLYSIRVRARARTMIRRWSEVTIEFPDPKRLARQTARHIPVWILFSAMNVFVLNALGGSVDGRLLIDLTFVTCVSWMAGFVIVGLPGGLGVREAVFISMLAGPIGAGLALSVAVVSRIVSIAVDLIGAGLSLLLAQTGPSRRSDEPDTTTVTLV
jgi:uncharacterized membrane protein YbhN (UPF0104 family)